MFMFCKNNLCTFAMLIVPKTRILHFYYISTHSSRFVIEMKNEEETERIIFKVSTVVKLSTDFELNAPG